MNFNELNDRQKATLTEEVLRANFLPFELMDRGIQPVGLRPIPLPVPEVPATPTREYHVVSVPSKQWYEANIAFVNHTDAQAFMKLNPLVIYNDKVYPGREDSAPALTTRILPDHERPVDNSAAIKRRDEIVKQNEEAQKEWESRRNSAEEVYEELEAEVYRCVRRKNRAEETNKIAAEYLTLCKGDEEMALQFLLKVRTQDQIDDARGFFLLEEAIA